MTISSSQPLNFLLKMEDTSSMAAIVARDMVDNAGRISQAYKRDANDGKERLLEENLTTLIWGFGIKFIKQHVFNPLAKKFSSMKYPNFDLTLLNKGPQKLTPELVKTFAPNDTHLLKLASNPKLQKTYKLMGMTKFLIATGIPIALISFGIPTLNQALTKKRLQKERFEKEKHLYEHLSTPVKRAPTFSPFQTTSPKPSLKNIQFGNNWVNKLSTVVENNRLNTLLVDATISGGRTYKARNKYERFEVLFQEAGIVFFLYYAADHIQNALSKWIDKSKNTASNLPFKTLKNLSDKESIQAITKLSKGYLSHVEGLSEEKLVQQVRNTLLDSSTANEEFKQILKFSQQHGWVPMKNKTLDITKKIDTASIQSFLGDLKNLKAVSKNTHTGLESLLKKSFKSRVGTFIVSNVICTICLGWVIPALKQYMTYKLTDSKEFPGTMV